MVGREERTEVSKRRQGGGEGREKDEVIDANEDQEGRHNVEELGRKGG